MVKKTSGFLVELQGELLAITPELLDHYNCAMVNGLVHLKSNYGRGQERVAITFIYLVHSNTKQLHRVK